MMREYGRKKNPRAALSRGVTGVRGRALIVNLPGSPRGAVESLDAVAELLPHALEVLRGARTISRNFCFFHSTFRDARTHKGRMLTSGLASSTMQGL